MNKNHAARGYNQSPVYGSHIAYHFMVGKDGTVIQNRSLTERTYHTRNDAINLAAIAIVAAGDFSKERPSEAQLKALRELIAKLDSIYHFERIMPHHDASATACPGKFLDEALKDVWRNPVVGDQYAVTRYYTPIQWQERYYRSVESTSEMLEKALDFGIVKLESGDYVHYEDTAGILFSAKLGRTKAEAIAFINSHNDVHYLLKRHVEYQMDFKVNCSGDCLVTADGYRLKPEDAMKVAACPPDMPFATRLLIEGIGQVVCHDRGGAIKEKRLDVWAGIGMDGLRNIRDGKAGILSVTVLAK